MTTLRERLFQKPVTRLCCLCPCSLPLGPAANIKTIVKACLASATEVRWILSRGFDAFGQRLLCLSLLCLAEARASS